MPAPNSSARSRAAPPAARRQGRRGSAEGPQKKAAASARGQRRRQSPQEAARTRPQGHRRRIAGKAEIQPLHFINRAPSGDDACRTANVSICPAQDFHLNKPSKTTPSLPSKAELLAFIGERPGKVGTREIARAFGLKNAAARRPQAHCCASSPTKAQSRSGARSCIMPARCRRPCSPTSPRATPTAT